MSDKFSATYQYCGARSKVFQLIHLKKMQKPLSNICEHFREQELFFINNVHCWKQTNVSVEATVLCKNVQIKLCFQCDVLEQPIWNHVRCHFQILIPRSIYYACIAKKNYGFNLLSNLRLKTDSLANLVPLCVA